MAEKTAEKKTAEKKKRTLNPNRVSAVVTDEAKTALKSLTDAGLSADKVISKAIVAFASSDAVKGALEALA